MNFLSFLTAEEDVVSRFYARQLLMSVLLGGNLGGLISLTRRNEISEEFAFWGVDLFVAYKKKWLLQYGLSVQGSGCLT